MNTRDRGSDAALRDAGDSPTGVEVGQIHVVLNWFEELPRLVPTN